MTVNPPRSRPRRLLSRTVGVVVSGLAAGALVSAAPSTASAAQTSCTPSGAFNNCQRYTYSGGNQTFVVPKGVSRVDFRMWGAGGSTRFLAQPAAVYSGGAGGFTSGTVSTTPGQSLSVTVGGAGQVGPVGAYGGGGPEANADSQFGGGGGGGLSALWAGAPFLTSSALAIAGGGGGNVTSSVTASAVSPPGGGGGLAGGGGIGGVGGGGTQTSGGAGTPGSGCPVQATNGSQFQGGVAAAAGRPVGVGTGYEGGGGGGGGWFGGGGGRCRAAASGGSPAGGGGGGSGFVGGAGVTATTSKGSDGVPRSGSRIAQPPGTTDPQYAANAGRTGWDIGANAGLVVIQFFLPQTTITTPAAGTLTNDDTQDVTGTGTPGTTLTLKDQGSGATLCSTTVRADGSWACTTSALPEGRRDLAASEQDPLAPFATYPGSALRPITVDTTAPAAPTITSPVDGTTLTENVPTLTGTGEPGATLTLSDQHGPSVCAPPPVVDASGAWTCTPTAPLPDGPHAFTATQTDPAGNVSPPATAVNVVVNTIRPPVLTGPTSPTSSRRPAISGTGRPAATVTVSAAGGPVCQASVGADGTFSCSPTADLAYGSTSLTAVQQDSVVSGVSDSLVVTVLEPAVIVPPPPPAVVPPAPAVAPAPPSVPRATPRLGRAPVIPPVIPPVPTPSPPPASESTPESPAEPAQPAPPPSPPPAASAITPVHFQLASGVLVPGLASTMVGTLGPNSSDAPVVLTLTGRANKGVMYRGVDTDPAGQCDVRTNEFTCTITLQPGQQATVQIRLMADALAPPDFARQQLSVLAAGATDPTQVTVTTRVDTGPTETELLAASVSSQPGPFIVLLAILLFALAATEAEKRHHTVLDGRT